MSENDCSGAELFYQGRMLKVESSKLAEVAEIAAEQMALIDQQITALIKLRDFYSSLLPSAGSEK
jgi:hypothetical protein